MVPTPYLSNVPYLFAVLGFIGAAIAAQLGFGIVGQILGGILLPVSTTVAIFTALVVKHYINAI